MSAVMTIKCTAQQQVDSDGKEVLTLGGDVSARC